MFSNYKFSLTTKEQSAWQLYLRFLPDKYKKSSVWQLLHDLSYADSWTDEPMFKRADTDISAGIENECKKEPALRM